MSEKPTIARIKKFGKDFEISVDPDKALQYKKGEIDNLREVLLADNIFTDSKKGLVAGEGSLEEVFKTTDAMKIADIIIKEGEIQLTSEHRAQERDQRKKKLIHMIHIQAIDPTTKLPHPATRIEAALEEARVHLEDHKTVEEQFDDIIKKLRPIIPLSIETKKIVVKIPGVHAGKSYNVVKSSGKMLREEWLNDGSWAVELEMPAGMYPDFLEKVNSITSGEVEVKEA